MKLEIELVPKTSWYSNLRSEVSKLAWDNLRRSVYKKYGYRCGICGSPGRLACHEIWLYDDAHHIQSLKGFIALCDLCHHVKHIGLAGILADEGKIDYDAVVSHFMRVNQCTREEFELHKSSAFELWRQRNKYRWTILLGPYDSMLSKRK